MNKLKLNVDHIRQLAEASDLDGLEIAMIQDASELYLAYNKKVKAFGIYDQDDDPICRVKDLVEDPAKLAVDAEELKEQMEFVIANTSPLDALESFIEKSNHEKLIKKLNA